jgi:hypothetical protein
MKITAPILALTLLAALLAGCATATVLVTGERRLSIPVDHVKLYHAPPTGKYDVLGIVNGASGGHDQGALDRSIHAMKRKAASIGANGIIIQNGPGQSGGGAVAGYGGGGFFAGGFLSERTQVSGQAIFLHAEK